jgi:hypothetical protein
MQMFNRLKELLFGSNNNSTFIEYSPDTIANYREKYPDIEISEIKLPDLEHDKWFVIKKWYKNDGNAINKNERICKVETDSFALELDSFIDGYIYFRQKPKQQLKAGQVICVVVQKKL